MGCREYTKRHTSTLNTILNGFEEYIRAGEHVLRRDVTDHFGYGKPLFEGRLFQVEILFRHELNGTMKRHIVSLPLSENSPAYTLPKIPFHELSNFTGFGRQTWRVVGERLHFIVTNCEDHNDGDRTSKIDD